MERGARWRVERARLFRAGMLWRWWVMMVEKVEAETNREVNLFYVWWHAWARLKRFRGAIFIPNSLCIELHYVSLYLHQELLRHWYPLPLFPYLHKVFGIFRMSIHDLLLFIDSAKLKMLVQKSLKRIEQQLQPPILRRKRDFSNLERAFFLFQHLRIVSLVSRWYQW